MKRRALVVTLLILVALASLGSAQSRKRIGSGDLPVATARARTLAVVQEGLDEIGFIDGVAYRIVVPANWNGTLLVYAHGYGEGAYPPVLVPPATPAADTLKLQNGLLAQGFALAASQMAGSGWQVKEGIQDTVALTSAFRDMVGKPKRTIIWGRSMGALMALGMIEKFPGLYDAAIALCPPAAGTPRRFDQAMDIALAYSVAFDDWDPAWGTPGDLASDLNWPSAKAAIEAHNNNAGDQAKWEFVRRVNGIPANMWVKSSPGRAMAMAFAVGVRAELELRAGGPVAENVGRTYRLSPDDQAALANMGVDWKSLLDRMNTSPAYAPPNARNYVEHYVDPSGRINRPVLTLHTEGDPVATPGNEEAYYRTVHGQGNTDLLLQVFTTGAGHCTFTWAQELAAVTAMMSWLDNGQKPDGSFFTAPGFDLGWDMAKHPWLW